LLGAEAQVGQATYACHQIVQPIAKDYPPALIDNSRLQEGSMASFPILQANQIAGCLYIISPQVNFFTPTYLDLLQNYASLLVLATEDDGFYHPNQISLGIMPSREQQLPFVSHFQARVSQLLIQSKQNNLLLTRAQAEIRVWQALEEEFLYS
jgi:hypothetical protein